MGSLSQYIELYRSHSGEIDSHSTALLNRLRPAALDALTGKELPDRHTEGYEKTSIDEMMAPDYGLNINRVNIPVDAAKSFRCGVPSLTGFFGAVVNDFFVPSTALSTQLPEGVIFTSLANACEKHPDIVERYYGKIASLEQAPTALNTLLVQDGVFIYIPKGVMVEKPLQLVNVFSSPAPLMAVRRVLIIVDDGASAQLLACDHTQDSSTSYLSLQTVEIALGRDSQLDYYDLEESSADTRRCSSVYAVQETGSTLLVNGSTLSCGMTRNDFSIDVAGDHCSTLLAGMAIGSDRQHIDNNSLVNHRGRSCHSRQLFKYVLDDDATGAFEGGIVVNEGAEKTEAYQSDRNLLASTGARMHTKPQLLIYCDDVKCSHGATTGQLDQEALFYMRSRGISEKTARTMLMQAFMGEVIDTVKMDGLRERLHLLVEKRLHGQKSFCGDCHATTCIK